MKTAIRITGIVLGAIVVVAIIASVLSGGKKGANASPAASPSHGSSASSYTDSNGFACDVADIGSDGLCPADPNSNSIDTNITPSDTPTPTPTSKPTYASLTDAGWAQIAKNPDGHAGEAYKVYGKITQFDSATGSDQFRADIGGARRYPDEFGYINYPTNTFLDGDSGILEPYVEGDLFSAKVSVVGAYTYTTTMGGEMSVPELRIVSIHKLGHVDN